MLYRALLLLFVVGALLTFMLDRSMRTYSVHAVLSGSMGHAAPTGSLIVTKRSPVTSYQVGDIVTFPLPSSPKQTVTHRIVRMSSTVQGSIVQTKGDANPNGDGWSVPAAYLQGKVMLVVPLLGYWCMALQSAIGYILFALVTLLLIVLPLAVASIRELKHRPS